MRTILQFSILGNGFIAAKHKEFIERHPQAGLRYVIDPEGAGDLSDLDQFLAVDEGSTDVVCITSPNHLHVRQGHRLMEAGYHVIIEKPLGLDSEEAAELVLVAERTRRKALVVMQNRYSPLSIWLKQVVDAGLLGEIFHVQVNCYWNRGPAYYSKNPWHGTKEQDGGSLFTQFSHFIDLLYWVFGTYRASAGHLYNFNHQGITEFADSGFVNLQFKSGIQGQFNFTTSCFSRNLESAVTILAQRGTIKLGGQYMEQLIHCDAEVELPAVPESYGAFGPYSGNAANHRFVIGNAVDAILHEAAIDTPLEEGVEVIRIIESMYGVSNT